MRYRLWALACIGGAGLAGCVSLLEPDLPDLRRGRQAVEYGDIQAAEYDLLPLAQEGYPEAQVRLAAAYAQLGSPNALKSAAFWYRSAFEKDSAVALPLARVLLRLGDMAALAEAERFLHQAMEQGDERALAGLIDLYTDYPERDRHRIAPGLVERAAKLRAPEAEAAVVRWYRHNAHEPHYAKALVQRCRRAQERLPDCYVDLARYYRGAGAARELAELAAGARKRYAGGGMPALVLERTAWSLMSDDIAGAPLPELAHPLLRLVVDTSATAQVRMARLLVEYPHLDPEANPEKLLLAAVSKGSPDAALALGRLYMNGTRVAADPKKAEHYLQQAADTLPAAHFYLGQIYKRGYLGGANPVRAAHHYLLAARSGYLRADYALAQLWSDSRGVRVNRANAYVFATLAVTNAVPLSPELLNQLRVAMTPQEQSKAQALLQQELVVRQSAPTPTAQLPSKTAEANRPGGSP